MTKLPDKNVLIFMLASTAMIVFPHWYHLPASIVGFFYALLVWRLLGVWRPNGLPNRWVVFGLTLGGLGLIYLQHQGIFGRDAGTQLFLVALALKLMELKTERDWYLIIYLAFIVAASQFLYEQSLWMAGYILLVCCVLFATLVSINSLKPAPWQALRTASVIVLQALPMAVVLFVLFPRLEAPHWMWLDDRHQARMGLGDTMEPGSLSELGRSTELAFRVQFSGPLPPPAQRYWRGPVLTFTDGKRWTQARHGDFSSVMDTPAVSGTAYRYTLLMEPQEKNWVYALDLPGEYQEPLSRNSYFQLVASGNPDKRSEYPVTSYLQYNTGYITRIEYREATQLPDSPSPEIERFIKQLHGDDAPPEQLITAVLRHFRTENFRYTLTPPLMEDKPIETFLFQTRSGFCSHYASAFVYLMRAAKIPARVVTGYQGGEFNPVGRFLEVHQYDAHAWAEVWLKGKGWVRVDPTAAVAPERIEKNLNLAELAPGEVIEFTGDGAGQRLSWLKQARQLWGNVDYHWQRWVINYNRNNQAEFLKGLGLADLKAMLSWLVGLCIAIGAVASALLLYRKPQPVDGALRHYRRFCQKLSKHGLIKRPSEGETDFADRVAASLPQVAEPARQITALFVHLRYGKDAKPDAVKELAKIVKVFKVI